MHQDDGSRLGPQRPAEQPAVRTTIVGGRPPGSGRAVGAVPRGIEVLLKKAAVDGEFRTALLARRAGSADLIGLRLEPAEAAMLDAAPAAQLEAIIAATRVDDRVRPAFLGRAAGVMLAALTAVGAGCDRDAPTKGVRPDDPAAADRATAPANPAAVAEGALHSIEPIEPHRIAFETPTPERVVVVAVDGRPVDVRPDGPPNWGRPGELITVYVAGRPVFVPLPVTPVAYSAGMAPDLPPTAPPTSQPAGPAVDQVTRGARPDLPPTTQPGTSTTQPDAAAATTQPDGLIAPAELERLITQLDDREFAVREAAQRRLEQGGLAVLPKLKEALAGGKLTPETAERIREVVNRAERIQGLVGQLGEPVVAIVVAGFAAQPLEPPADRAERGLVAIGPKALPVLRDMQAGGKLSPEVDARVRRIITTLDPKPAPSTTQPEAVPPTTQPGAGHGRPIVQPREVAGARADIPPPAVIAGVQPALPPAVQPPTPPPARSTTQPDASTTQPDAGAIGPDEFERLVRELDDPKFAVREAAHKRLLEAGKPLLPQIRERLAAKNLPPETAWRLGEVVKALDPPAAITVEDQPELRVIVGLGGRF